MKLINWEFRERRYPTQHRTNSLRQNVIKSRFSEMCQRWRHLSLEQMGRWEKWATSSKRYKSGRSAFIGLNMIAATCGITTPRLNPPPENQPIPAKPSSPWISYAYGKMIVGYTIPDLQGAESAILRLWISFSSRRRYSQIAEVVNLKDAHHRWSDDGILFVDGIRTPSCFGDAKTPLASFIDLTIKAHLDIVATAEPNTAPLVSEPSEVSEVVIAN